MGMTSDAHCFHCGYDTVLGLGGSMRTFETHASWPVSCQACAEVTTANYLETPLFCEKCWSTDVVRVSDPRFWKGDGNSRDGLAEERKAMMTDGHYRCPKCRKFELRFGTNVAGHSLEFWD